MEAEKTYTLLGPDRKPYVSATPGRLGGHRRGKTYGRLDCPAALRAIAKGGYVKNRVFFPDEATAIAAGFRPCGACLREKYAAWKQAREEADNSQPALVMPSRSHDVVPEPEGAHFVPGWLIVTGWLTLEQHRWIVARFNEWTTVRRSARRRSAGTMSVRTVAEIPTMSPGSLALSRALRTEGFAFVGPTTMYALMEPIGIIDTHLIGSHRRGSSGAWPR